MKTEYCDCDLISLTRDRTSGRYWISPKKFTTQPLWRYQNRNNKERNRIEDTTISITKCRAVAFAVNWQSDKFTTDRRTKVPFRMQIPSFFGDFFFPGKLPPIFPLDAHPEGAASVRSEIGWASTKIPLFQPSPHWFRVKWSYFSILYSLLTFDSVIVVFILRGL